MSAFPPPPRLKARSEFLRAATGRKGHTGLVTIQAKPQAAQPPDELRVGFTASKKVGNAIQRNRAKRRLREAVRVERDLGFRPGHDYVIVARQDVVTASWPALLASLRSAIRKAHAGGRPGSGNRVPTEQPRARHDFPSSLAVTHDGRQ